LSNLSKEFYHWLVFIIMKANVVVYGLLRVLSN
jgi:hypothetical protein